MFVHQFQDEVNVEDMLKGINIPTPPQIVADLQMEMVSAEPDLNAMSSLIAGDVGLAGAVLKIVNSPFYAGRGSISSVTQAVMHLGIKTVIEIVNAHCLRETCIPEDLPKSTYAALIRFWDTATDVAKVCTMAARILNISPKESVYTLGLFHNVGIALLATKYENYFSIMRDSYNQNTLDITEYESKLLNTNHSIVGYYVARAWKLDDNLCQLIGQHHRRDLMLGIKNDDAIESQLFAILKIAEHITGLHRILGNTDEDLEWGEIGQKVMDVTGFSKYEMEELELQARDNGIGSQQYFN